MAYNKNIKGEKMTKEERFKEYITVAIACLIVIFIMLGIWYYYIYLSEKSELL